MTPKTRTETICRICLLGTQVKYVSLFEPFMEFSPAYHINSITNIHVCEEDSLPGSICLSCLSNLENAVNFKLKCETSDAYLKKQTLDAEKNLLKLELSDKVHVKEEGGKDNSDHDIDNLKEDSCDEKGCSLNQVNYLFTKSKTYLADVPSKIDAQTNSAVVCHDCGGVFKTNFKFKVHWKKVHKPKHYDCELCNARFCSMKALQRHKLNGTEKCKILNTVKIDGFGKDRKFTCPTCHYSTQTYNCILQHITSHTGEKKFKCSMCEKCYSQRSGLDVHLETFHKIIKKTLTCDICGIVLHSQTKFTKHMYRHSSLRYSCDLCHKNLKSKESLRVHIKRHEGVKRYNCEYCAKLFGTSTEVTNHKKAVHFNETIKKLLNCPLCPFKSHNKRAMDSHREKHESGDFSCEICGHFYETELLFWLHKICHLSLDSVARRICPFCDRMYEKNSLLRSHIKSCHLKGKDLKYDDEEVIDKIKKAWAADKNQSNHRIRKKDINR